jgi:hypothetical protein
MVMPALIGGFLRHGHVANGVFCLFYFRHLCEQFISFLSITQESKHKEALYKALLKGCRKRKKAPNINEELSTLDLTSVIFLSLTEVNSYFKDG